MSVSEKKRVSIGAEHREVCEMPNLISIQVDSYKRFLQKDRVGTKEGPDPRYGLEAVFRSIFPVVSYDGKLMLSYKGYTLGFDKKDSVNLNEKECRRRGQNYSVSVNAKLELKNLEDMTVQEKDLYFGEMPLMTDRGSFIINGSERVVVSQIHRSPGVIAQREKGVYSSRVIPAKGSWLEFEIDDKHPGVYAKIDRKKRILVTIFLRALGLRTREDIVKAFYCSRPVKSEQWRSLAQTKEASYSFRDCFAQGDSKEKIIRAGDRLTPEAIESLIQNGLDEIEIIDFTNPSGLGFDDMIQCFEKEEDLVDSPDGEPSMACVVTEMYLGMQQTEPPSIEKALQDISSMFFDKARYDLGEVGKYKINAKFYHGDDKEQKGFGPDDRALRLPDMIETIKYLVNVFHGKEPVDDIDHLGNRRVRSVGELLENQLEKAFQKLARTIKDKMAGQDLDKVKIADIVSSKVITTSIRDFFQSSQLSQFMDQVNPLSELTHKRRITALGPGGLNRERASFEVRDVHYTHYGRMCPIETPEGQNIGLIVSLANYTKVTGNGFLETPYRRVVNGRATDEIKYLDATEEEHYYIAQANAQLDGDGNFLEQEVSVRKKGEYSKQEPKDIDYMDVSPRQVISVAASLIPFLEHDDANRALMGSNMQRQAVPLVFPEAPRIGTGMEGKAAYDSGALVKAKRDGVVSYVSSTQIRIAVKDGSASGRKKGEEDVYDLEKNIRTNAETCFNQRPIVSKGDEVKAGDPIADGPACDRGELALGRNILVGFVPWNGYNYEDAVLISERVVKEDLFTSVHISEQSVDVRETKLGVETVTRDLPNVSEENLRNLDENGIVRIGTKVKAGDILVGKVTPKSEGDNTPEVKLLNAVFGDKSRETKNTSLKMPHGSEGVVVRVDRLSRKDGDILPVGVEESVRVQIANKRKLVPGDKMAGRHGNKGVVSRILPVEDMPFMEDGTPLDVCLNPLGVPSRMNIGQLMETQLGWAAVKLDEWFSASVFQSASMEQIQEQMRRAGLPETSKVPLYDGRTGEKFVNDVFCGYIYYLKLNHLVNDKVHARSTGPYSMVTQQPLGGRAKFGGQRFGEMEVWALEAYGAANTLEEMLTIKSDDMTGRMKAYDSIVKGELAACQGSTEAFKVLIQEVRGLCLDMQAFDSKGKQVPLTERDVELLGRNKG